nr:hypothetical protein [Tanacetum cinerariifolium]
REEGDRTNSVTRPNLRTQHPSEKSLVSNPPIMTVDVAASVVADTSFVLVPRAGYEPVHQAIFVDSASMGEADPDVSGPSHPAGTELFMESFYVSSSCAFSKLCNMDYDQLLVEFNVGVARQTCLSSEERLSLKEAEVVEAIRLRGQVSTVEAMEAARVAELNSLKEQTMASRGMKLVVMKCLQSSDYLSALGGTIGRAIDKGMHDGLATSIEHEKAGRGLVDVVANNPFAETNYVSTVNVLRSVEFPLLAQLES